MTLTDWRSRDAPMPSRRWGKAGQRLTVKEIEARDAAARANANRVAYVQRRNDEVAYKLWRGGGLKPYAITIGLDAQGLYGPEVDQQCGAAEPDVDMWEAGKLYPTWTARRSERRGVLVTRGRVDLCRPTQACNVVVDLACHTPCHRVWHGHDLREPCHEEAV